MYSENASNSVDFVNMHFCMDAKVNSPSPGRPVSPSWPPPAGPAGHWSGPGSVRTAQEHTTEGSESSTHHRTTWTYSSFIFIQSHLSCFIDDILKWCTFSLCTYEIYKWLKYKISCFEEFCIVYKDGLHFLYSIDAVRYTIKKTFREHTKEVGNIHYDRMLFW